jgi:hypothetical protein
LTTTDLSDALARGSMRHYLLCRTPKPGALWRRPARPRQAAAIARARLPRRVACLDVQATIRRAHSTGIHFDRNCDAAVFAPGKCADR